ncbi:MAG: phosphoadenosine phosphosulfate reductase family protein, partial [Desulfobacteraceae bacterium]|nr:phosphoadenosine phosphosulfate reductase family protein [Desulfobacteraceae bacterium]
MTYEDKLLLTKMRIQQWVDHFGVDHVVVSFSGGKDSTVLLDIVSKMYPEIKACFSDTGMEYPEIRNFVKTYKNKVAWVKPERTFRDVLFTEGYPIVSKKVSEQIKRLRMGTTDKNKASHNLIRTGYTREGRYVPSRKLANKWKFLEDAPFKISDKCCDVFKKSPLTKYYKKHNLNPMTAMMKSEGGQRALAYQKCNLYDAKTPISNPMFKW